MDCAADAGDHFSWNAGTVVPKPSRRVLACPHSLCFHWDEHFKRFERMLADDSRFVADFLGDREPRRVRTCHADLCGIRDPEFQGREELGRAPRSIRRGQQTPIAGPIRSIRPAPQVGSPEPNGNHREPRPLPPPTSKFTAQTRFGLHRRVVSKASSTPEPTTGHARPDATCRDDRDERDRRDGRDDTIREFERMNIKKREG